MAGARPDEDGLSVRDLFIELTNYCNFHCTFCTSDLQSRTRGMMAPEVFHKACDDVLEGQLTDHLAFHVMGEPLLHPRFFEFLEYATAKGLRVILNTNCSLLTEERVSLLMDRLQGALLLSVQTPTRETFELRGSPNLGWETYLQRVRHTLSAYLANTRGEPGKNYIELHMLNTKQCNPNAKVISDEEQARQLVLTWGQMVSDEETKLGLDFSDFRNQRLAELGDPLAPNYHGKAYDLAPGIVLRFKGAGTFANYCIQPGARVVPKSQGSCPIPSQQLAVLWNGDVSLCCLDFDGDMVVGNIREKSLKEIWMGEDAMRIREEMAHGVLSPGICQHCLGEVVLRKSFKQLATEVAANYRQGGVPLLVRATRGFLAKRRAAQRQGAARCGPQKGED